MFCSKCGKQAEIVNEKKVAENPTIVPQEVLIEMSPEAATEQEK